MAQHNENVALHVPYKIDRYVTARMLESFIREQMAQINTTKTFSEF